MLNAGDRVDEKYTILRLIGDGGMGTVYEARHERLGTRVALKFLHEDLAERPGLSERFLQEAKLAATIVSPHVVRVTDMDTMPGGPPYLVMDFVTGESLEHLLEREKKLAPERAVAFALQIVSGLEAAHAIGAVHRDLKPGNVLVTPAAEGPRLMLIDFGIAKLRDPSGGRGITRTGVVLGTPEYMPPEQLFAASDVDARADIYALGVMLFEMLSGHRPAEGDSAEAIVGKVLSGDVLSLATLEPSLPAALVEVVRRATAGDRDARYPSVSAVRGALEGALRRESRPPTTISDAPPERLSRTTKGATELGEPPPESRAPQRGSTELGGAEPAYGRASLPAAPPARKRKRAPFVVIVLLVLLSGLGVALAVVALKPRPRAIPPLPTAEPPPTGALTPETPTAPTFTVPTPTVPPAPTTTPPTATPPATPTATPPATPTATPPATPTAPDAGVVPIPFPTFQFPTTLPPLPFPFPGTSPADAGAPAPTPVPTATPTTKPTAPQKPGIGRRDAGSGK
jgi:eukaryotic-like serine/threonine-protein kinase